MNVPSLLLTYLNPTNKVCRIGGQCWKKIVRSSGVASSYSFSSFSRIPSNVAAAVAADNRKFPLIASKRNIVHTSRYAPVDVPNEDLFTFLTANVPYNKSKIAAVDAVTGRECTVQQLVDGAVSIGSALVKRGLQPGEVVGVAAPNCVEYMMMMLGVPGVGATLSPINQALNVDELEVQMRAAKIKFVFTTKEVLPVISEAVARLDGSVEDVFVIDSSSSFSSLLRDDGSAFPSESERRSIIDPSTQVAVIPFSSGTTGMPKGVELTHFNVVANTTQVSGHSDLVGPAEDGSRGRSLSLLPMWHSYMLISSFVSMRYCTMFCIMPKFDPILLLESIAKHELDFLPLVPPLILFLAKHPIVSKYDLSSVQEIMSGAAPLGPDLHNEVSQRLGISKVRQAWGMSELSPGATVVPASEPLPGSCGVLIPNTELKIVDITDRSPLKEGQDGEVAVRGPQVMKGYLNNPSATHEMIDDEGWLYTGDIGHVDESGHLKIVDRLKELIKYKGHQVAPAELEGILLTHPSVADAAVIGIPDEAAGEVPRAYVQLKAESIVEETDIVDFVNAHVGAFSWLRGGVRFIDAIPKATSGKILRRELREKHKKESLVARADR